MLRKCFRHSSDHYLPDRGDGRESLISHELYIDAIVIMFDAGPSRSQQKAAAGQAEGVLCEGRSSHCPVIWQSRAGTKPLVQLSYPAE